MQQVAGRLWQMDNSKLCLTLKKLHYTAVRHTHRLRKQIMADKCGILNT